MSAFLGLRSRAFSIVAVFAALLLSMSFASSATAVGGGKGASDKVLTSGVEAYAKPGKEKGNGAGKKDRDDVDGGNSKPVDGSTDRPTICHATGSGWIRIPPSSPSWGLEGHANHGDDQYVGPDEPCGAEDTDDEVEQCGDAGVTHDPTTGEPCDEDDETAQCGDAGVTHDPTTGEPCDEDDETAQCGDAGVTHDPTSGEPCDEDDETAQCGDVGVTHDPTTGNPCENRNEDGNDDGPGADDDTSGKDPVIDPVETPDPDEDVDENDGGAPKPGTDKPGEDNDGEPGDGGVKPIIKPVDKTPVVKGVEKKRGVKPGAGSPVAAPQAGSPSTGAPTVGVAPTAAKGNRPGANVLPNTGLEDHLGVLTAGGLALLLAGGVLVAPRRRRPLHVAR